MKFSRQMRTITDKIAQVIQFFSDIWVHFSFQMTLASLPSFARYGAIGEPLKHYLKQKHGAI